MNAKTEKLLRRLVKARGMPPEAARQVRKLLQAQLELTGNTPAARHAMKDEIEAAIVQVLRMAALPATEDAMYV